jgi:tripeptide aminopeptidase
VALPSLIDHFLELCAIPSPPGEERAAADRVEGYLSALRLKWDEDGTGPAIGSTAGNITCRLPGAGESGTPIFLCAHLDTVPLDGGTLDPVVEDGIVRNAGGTILGADNKSAVAVMLEAARRIVEEGRPHAGVELVLTTMEEIGLRGAHAYDWSRLRAGYGYVYDHAAPIGMIVLGSPWQRSLHARFHGRSAHAGMAPEEGRSAIVAAARAIADLRLGRLDEETTASIGVIAGGTARNVVPERCAIEGEARSHDERKLTGVVQEMLDACAFAATVSECTVETEVQQLYRGYRFRRGDPAVAFAARAMRRCGIEPSFGLSGGGADANVCNDRGLACVNLANGMTDIHTPDEHIATADLELMVDLTLALVDEARGAD